MVLESGDGGREYWRAAHTDAFYCVHGSLSPVIAIVAVMVGDQRVGWHRRGNG
jgi:hypothetical protein